MLLQVSINERNKVCLESMKQSKSSGTSPRTAAEVTEIIQISSNGMEVCIIVISNILVSYEKYTCISRQFIVLYSMSVGIKNALCNIMSYYIIGIIIDCSYTNLSQWCTMGTIGYIATMSNTQSRTFCY